MKGFPRRGSDSMLISATSPPHPRLNEGLPQKGKRCLHAGAARLHTQASMKGFPRRGSDTSVQPWGQPMSHSPQ